MRVRKDLYIISLFFLTSVFIMWLFISKFGIIVFDVLVKPHFVII